MSSPNPLKQAEQAALAQLNKEKTTLAGWIVTNKVWLIAVAGALVLGFIVTKVM